jgi:hypothetical protein
MSTLVGEVLVPQVTSTCWTPRPIYPLWFTSRPHRPEEARRLFPSIVLQNSKVAAVQIFGVILKRKEVDDSRSFSRATEVAHEFGARR